MLPTPVVLYVTLGVLRVVNQNMRCLGGGWDGYRTQTSRARYP